MGWESRPKGKRRPWLTACEPGSLGPSDKTPKPEAGRIWGSAFLPPHRQWGTGSSQLCPLQGCPASSSSGQPAPLLCGTTAAPRPSPTSPPPAPSFPCRCQRGLVAIAIRLGGTPATVLQEPVWAAGWSPNFCSQADKVLRDLSVFIAHTPTARSLPTVTFQLHWILWKISLSVCRFCLHELNQP